ncbi:MAG: SHOCT domain-containing protein [Clostridia bacterium]|nr:SHOCT domain-containing protein [Clostridia bacterium]
MYDYYNLSKISGYYGGYYLDNSDVVEARKDADWALGNLIESKFEIDCFRGSYYLADNSYIEYTAGSYYPHLGILAITFGILLIASMLYLIDKKKSITVTEEKVVCENGKKVIKEFFVKDIKTVQLNKLRGLKIQGNGIKYNINMIKNADEIRMFLMESMEKENNSTKIAQNTKMNNIEELKHVKELLDIGAITQEEFDQKKKQLLGL